MSTPEDNRAFAIGLNRMDALAKVQHLARAVQDQLRNGGYYGPCAIAGGYVRDVALGKNPKDLDVFLDGGFLREMGVSVTKLAEMLCLMFPGGTRVERTIPCYGGWATDIDLVVKIDVAQSEGQTFTYLQGLPIPESIDLIVMRRSALEEHGYLNTLSLATVSDTEMAQDFLSHVISRVDLRMNAIGATRDGPQWNPAWDYDALAQRLVVQYARRHDKQERIDKRLERLCSEKFQGWTGLYEGPEGELSPVSFEEPALSE